MAQPFRTLPKNDFAKTLSLSPISSEPELQKLGLREARIHQSLADEAVLVLDLDKTALLGSDGNDMGLALQWMEKPESVVKELYARILSPCIRPAYEALKRKAKTVHVVIYTRRPSSLVYRSCFRDAMIPLQYKHEWHHDGQIYVPSEIQSADEVLQSYRGVELLEEEALDVKKALERTMAARDAIACELGLDEAPPVVVTASHKDVTATVANLGLPVENAFLFDDNPDLRHDPHAVCVPPLEGLPEPQRSDALSFMERELPAASLDDDLAEFLLGARPADRSLHRDHDAALAWRIPPLPHPPLPWRIPLLSVPRPPPARRHTGSILAATSSPSLRERLEERSRGACGGEQTQRMRISVRRTDSRSIVL